MKYGYYIATYYLLYSPLGTNCYYSSTILCSILDKIQQNRHL